MGRLAAVCISATGRGDEVSAVISQMPAVSCIHPPILDTVEASHRLRNTGSRSGANPEPAAGCEGDDSDEEGRTVGDDKVELLPLALAAFVSDVLAIRGRRGYLRSF